MLAIKLYALKCEEGYIRYSLPGGSKCVGLSQATVCASPDDLRLVEAFDSAVRSAVTDLRLVELSLVENDYYARL